MMFTFEEKQNLITNFPNIKLSYENLIHNKVTPSVYDLYTAIPCGKKCFAWFTTIYNKNICLIMELINNKMINDIKIYDCAFNNDLTYGKNGTIIFGTHFNYSQSNFFTIENIYYWKGEDVINMNTYEKMTCIKKMLTIDIKQVCYNKKYIVFGLPLLSNSLKGLDQSIKEVGYKIYKIQLYKFNKINYFDSFTYKNIELFLQQKEMTLPVHLPAKDKYVNTKKIQKKHCVFKIKPDVQNDIYHLYCLDKNEDVYFKIAYIPDFKTSVMMNKLFRNIKENDNLDLLEESDDEEEFQNEKDDRFVDITKSFNMVCGFNYKFKKWFPISLANDSEKIVQYSELDH